jgi:rfaE bifunctional protein kinase chain/domain
VSESVLKDYVTTNKPDELAVLAAKVREFVPKKKRIAFVSGNFNIVHPGHFRLLNFAAECADFLVVGVNSDATPGTLVPEALRLEGVRTIEAVNLAILLPVAAQDFLQYLKPDIVVKGSEHEKYFNPEQAIIDEYGGKLVFSSGEMRFSSIDLLRCEVQEAIFSAIKKPIDYLHRHSINDIRLSDMIHKFPDISVVVLGDLIVDEYVTCDPLGISREDPTIVVTPIKKDIFIGGAGIVAAHARGLGANVKYFSVVGDDDAARFAENTLKKFGVDTCLIQDISRPTTLKQRFRAETKTLLRVSHLRHHHIDSDLIDTMQTQLVKAIENADLVVFSDFNYGCLPQPLIESVVTMCNKRGVPMVADSQSSSQIGDISRFQGMMLITPTEHEARLATRDQTSGLVVLAESLRKQAHAKHVFITLGSEGLFIHSPGSESELASDQLPAFNSAPKDVAGGGDSLLICSSLALAVGATIWEGAYLGSVAAACHVARVGNLPLSAKEVLQELYI